MNLFSECYVFLINDFLEEFKTKLLKFLEISRNSRKMLDNGWGIEFYIFGTFKINGLFSSKANIC